MSTSNGDAANFFDRFNAYIDNGWPGQLTPMQKDVYLATLRHMNTAGEAWPGAMRVGGYMGHLRPGHVRKARADLVRLGLLTLVSKGGGRASSKYLVNVPPPVPESGTGTRIGPGSKSERHPTPNRRPTGIRIGAPPVSESDHRRANGSPNLTTQQQHTRGDDAAEGVCLLVDFGFKRREAEELATEENPERLAAILRHVDGMKARGQVRTSKRALARKLIRDGADLDATGSTGDGFDEPAEVTDEIRAICYPPEERAVREELQSIGVREPKLHVCAAVTGITPSLVALEYEIAKKANKDKAVGTLINKLTSGYRPPAFITPEDIHKHLRPRLRSVCGYAVNPELLMWGVEFLQVGEERIPAQHLRPEVILLEPPEVLRVNPKRPGEFPEPLKRMPTTRRSVTAARAREGPWNA